MAENSHIQWTDATWNPTTGCTKISPGCANCYIESTPPFRMAGRKFVNGKIPLILHEDRLEKPLDWKKPKRIFVNSLSDLFHEDVPDDFIDRVFAVMALCPQHTFQVLTKRPERMAAYLSSVRVTTIHGLADDRAREIGRPQNSDGGFMVWPGIGGGGWPLPNVWLGVSVENQAAADERIPLLLQTPAVVRFLSCEPLLGPVDLRPWMPPGPANWQCQKCQKFQTDFGRCLNCGEHGNYLSGSHAANKRDPSNKFTGSTNRQPLDWCIVGGESGHGARPCNVAWIRSIVEQCKQAQVSVFVKQLGSVPVDPYPHGSEPKSQRWPISVSRWTESGTPYLRDKKGGDIDEWPADLRVREFPKAVLA